MSGIMVFSLFFGLYYLAGKVRWLNELHVRLDHRFFGFLNKSNDAIFSTLITALPPNEQSHYRSFPNEKKHKTTQSIFSNLSIDNELYTALFQSGIFKMWIRYWVTIYGTFAFILLTTGSFTSLIVRLDSSVRDVFTLSWILALLHILLSVVIGRYLVKRTQATVQQIVDTHCLEIAGLLRVNIVDIPVVIEDEDVAHIDDEF